MRGLALLSLAVSLAGCSTYANDTQSTRASRQLQSELAGRVAGAPVRCLQSNRARDMVTIDERTILFRDGRTTYLNRVRGSCSGLGGAGYSLLTRSFGGYGLCEGDIAQVVDVRTGTVAGGCSLGEFVPYTRS